jgi:hypothetical protein
MSTRSSGRSRNESRCSRQPGVDGRPRWSGGSYSGSMVGCIVYRRVLRSRMHWLRLVVCTAGSRPEKSGEAGGTRRLRRRNVVLRSHSESRRRIVTACARDESRRRRIVRIRWVWSVPLGRTAWRRSWRQTSSVPVRTTRARARLRGCTSWRRTCGHCTGDTGRRRRRKLLLKPEEVKTKPLVGNQ